MTTKINMLAIDLAKGSFQVCAFGPDGAVQYTRALSRTRLAALLAEQPACVVAVEACATSHHRSRVAERHGHEVQFVPAACVKPFVKCQSEAEKKRSSESFPAERSRGRGSHRGGGHAPEFKLVRASGLNDPGGHSKAQNALGGGEERRDQGPSSGVPDAQMPCPATHAAHQHVVQKARLWGDARPGATTKVHGRKDRAGLGQQDGSDRYPPSADRRCPSRQHAAHAPAGQCMSVIRWLVRKGGSSNRWMAALVVRKPKMVAAVALANTPLTHAPHVLPSGGWPA